MDFSRKIRIWYKENRRHLPWRETINPYKIWLSEIILQQTKVNQGLSYYLKFVEEFPTITHLANASEEKILKTWQGLGYYSRARNLHLTAKHIQSSLDGTFPTTYDKIIKLKGVGEYTAAAIASFCFKEPKAVVDGNVYRVLARVFNINLPIDSSEGKKHFKELASQLLEPNEPDMHNQAIMEFGALCCTPKKPMCLNCIFEDTCLAKSQGSITIRPVKKMKPKTKSRYFNYLVISSHDQILVNKREDNDIWKNLFEFPLFESISEIELHNLEQSELWNTLLSQEKKLTVNQIRLKKHILSHQVIYSTFWEITIQTIDNKSKYKTVKLSDFQELPIPKLIDNYFSNRKLTFAKE
ncbi:MAG: A/G-specific adenine glycosylase [Flavobacteriales bacterium]|nr:A/G-specific adenine glycosylase [Flavobacteriales bacterium]